MIPELLREPRNTKPKSNKLRYDYLTNVNLNLLQVNKLFH